MVITKMITMILIVIVIVYAVDCYTVGGLNLSMLSKDIIALLMCCVSLSIKLLSIELMAYSHKGLIKT